MIALIDLLQSRSLFGRCMQKKKFFFLVTVDGNGHIYVRYLKVLWIVYAYIYAFKRFFSAS